MKKILLIVLTVLALLFAGYMIAGINSTLTVVTYELKSEKITSGQPVRIAVIADFHGENYGGELLRSLTTIEPDFVVIPGDMLHVRTSEENAYALIRELGSRYPTYFVSGNHDIVSLRYKDMLRLMREVGVVILEGEYKDLRVGGASLRLVGIDDPTANRREQLSEVFGRIGASEPQKPAPYTILLAHRPERVGEYADYPIDLVISGHAHGGQWRIPGLLNGFYAPHQGFFPPYAGGVYEIDTADGHPMQMVVSRGLARTVTWIPRIYNRPEIVLLKVAPE